mgnify:FL=1
MSRSSTQEDGGDLPAMMPGFANHFVTEAVADAVPIGRNSPQSTPFGLYSEQLSGTAFTAPRADNRRSWLYRLRPTAQHRAYAPYAGASRLATAPFTDLPPSPNRLRWDPLPMPQDPTDFLDGLVTYGGNGDVAASVGFAVHLYACNRPMQRRAFFNADGEMLIVPQQGTLRLTTEMGRIDLAPQQVALVPRGVRFRVAPQEGEVPQEVPRLAVE